MTCVNRSHNTPDTVASWHAAGRTLSRVAVIVLVACGEEGTLVSPNSVPDPSDAIASVTVTPAQPVVEMGDTMQLTATVRNGRNEVVDTAALWTSDAPTVAQVDQDGRVAGLLEGTALIEASVAGVSGGASLTVTGDLDLAATVTFLQARDTTFLRQNMLLHVEARNGRGEVLDVSPTWSSSSTVLIAPYDDGSSDVAVVPVQTGDAEVHAEIDGITATAMVHVLPNPNPNGMTWPVTGVSGRDWVINNYVDRDPTGAILDYQGGGKSYDGHNGVDIDSPNFRTMDGDPTLVAVAARAGTITAMRMSEPDRNVGCTSSTWNYMEVTHADGSYAWYGHLKRDSSPRTVGESVVRGDSLAIIGSSGCSTQPHLHFELRDASNNVLDPFHLGLWEAPPEYDPPLTMMDWVIQSGGLSGVDELKDPGPNATAVTMGSRVGFGLSMAGSQGGPIRITVTDVDGALVVDVGRTVAIGYRHTYWYWNRTLNGAPGTWTVRAYLHGVERRRHALTVN
jgi:murein DD-endopeptidase MepM/ murein hydrolase activator NlpD